jgi:hypothetical protein
LENPLAVKDPLVVRVTVDPLMVGADVIDTPEFVTKLRPDVF